MRIPEEIISKGELMDIKENQFLINPKIVYKYVEYAGFYLGSKKKPSLTLCYELSKTKFPRTIISNKASEKFTRGENIYRKAVTNGRVTGEVLVMNKQHDCLGYGIWKDDVLLNVTDVGEFLRKEKQGQIA